MNAGWSRTVLREFDASARHYDALATLQHAMARRLAERCRRTEILSGFWVDLGSGTGQLAAALEAIRPGQTVLRVDGSSAMLRQHPSAAATERFDLSEGLPVWSQPPTLLASSFVLHWLPEPERQLRLWWDALAPGGVLALSVPIRGSFPQWHAAAMEADVPCTALPLPDAQQLLAAIPTSAIQLQRQLRFTQTAADPLRLLRPMAELGAGATSAPQLSAAAWRRLLRAWPEASGRSVRLSWRILLVLLRR